MGKRISYRLIHFIDGQLALSVPHGWSARNIRGRFEIWNVGGLAWLRNIYPLAQLLYRWVTMQVAQLLIGICDAILVCRCLGDGQVFGFSLVTLLGNRSAQL